MLEHAHRPPALLLVNRQNVLEIKFILQTTIDQRLHKNHDPAFANTNPCGNAIATSPRIANAISYVEHARARARSLINKNNTPQHAHPSAHLSHMSMCVSERSSRVDSLLHAQPSSAHAEYKAIAHLHTNTSGKCEKFISCWPATWPYIRTRAHTDTRHTSSLFRCVPLQLHFLWLCAERACWQWAKSAIRTSGVCQCRYTYVLSASTIAPQFRQTRTPTCTQSRALKWCMGFVRLVDLLLPLPPREHTESALWVCECVPGREDAGYAWLDAFDRVRPHINRYAESNIGTSRRSYLHLLWSRVTREKWTCRCDIRFFQNV